MTNLKYLIFTGLILLSAMFSACDDDDNLQLNEEELITTVRLTFSENGNSTTFFARDTDGDGGNPPLIDTIRLTSGLNYSMQIEFLDESNSNDIKDITSEVREESNDHLVCLTSNLIDQPTITDTDDNGMPL